MIDDLIYQQALLKPAFHLDRFLEESKVCINPKNNDLWKAIEIGIHYKFPVGFDYKL